MFFCLIFVTSTLVCMFKQCFIIRMFYLFHGSFGPHICLYFGSNAEFTKVATQTARLSPCEVF